MGHLRGTLITAPAILLFSNAVSAQQVVSPPIAILDTPALPSSVFPVSSSGAASASLVASFFSPATPTILATLAPTAMPITPLAPAASFGLQTISSLEPRPAYIDPCQWMTADRASRHHCECTEPHKKPMTVTAVFGIPVTINNATAVYGPTTSELYLTGYHWGTTDTERTYFPAPTAPGQVQFPTPTGNKDHIAERPKCSDEASCGGLCYRDLYDENRSDKIKTSIAMGVPLAAMTALAGASLCCCCFQTRRAHRPKNPKVLADPAPHGRVDPSVYDVPPTAIDNHRGTLGRQAEEGRVRPAVRFDEKPTEGAQHVENVGAAPTGVAQAQANRGPVPQGSGGPSVDADPASKPEGVPTSKEAGTPTSKVEGAPTSKVDGAPTSKVDGAPTSKVDGAPTSKDGGAPQVATSGPGVEHGANPVEASHTTTEAPAPTVESTTANGPPVKGPVIEPSSGGEAVPVEAVHDGAWSVTGISTKGRDYGSLRGRSVLRSILHKS